MNIEINIENIFDIRVRYADTDKMGVVYNGNYFRYFEIGRTELMRANGLAYTEFEKRGVMLPVIETGAKYFSPAYYDDVLSIKAALSFEWKPRIRFEYNIFRDNTTISTGFTEHSFMSEKTRRPVRPPKDLFEKLDKYLKDNK